MGAPKQKWTSAEDSALKAGVVKHGVGKWRIILEDPEFNGILCLRSNVDLKDKWRNIRVTENRSGSREDVRIERKRSQQILGHDDNSMALSAVVETNFDDDIVDAKPLAISSGTSQITGMKKSISRLDNVILEAVTNLKEPRGSKWTAIAMYIEDQYCAPPEFKRLLSAKLKALTESGKLIKVNCKYRIAPSTGFSEGSSSGLFFLEEKPTEYSRVEKDDFRLLTKSQIDAELAKMRNLTAQEAAAAAAQAVAEAEAALGEAEEAAREAAVAEADAEAAQAFAEAAMRTLRSINTSKLMFTG